MFLFQTILALVVAAVLAVLLVYPLRRYGPGPLEGVVFFFLLLFLAAWAGGLWLRPIGPLAWGVAWLGFVFAGLLVAFILAAASPRQRPSPPPTPGESHIMAEAIAMSLGVFFYAAIFAFLAAIVLRYIVRQA